MLTVMFAFGYHVLFVAQLPEAVNYVCSREHLQGYYYYYYISFGVCNLVAMTH